MKKVFIFFMTIGMLFANEVKVAIAANMSYSINELMSSFNKKYPNIKVLPIISGSGNLTAQIKNGAPYDIFMSANMKYPQNLYEAKLTATKPKVYAQGKLALVSRKIKNLSNLNILVDKKIENIALANPNLAPYGAASLEVLKNLKIYEKVKNKIIYGQNVGQTFTYALNVTSVGFVASSALHSPKLKGVKLFSKEIDTKLYTPINQGIVMLKRAEKNLHVKTFYDFVLSEKAKKIFKKYGYNIDE